MTATSLTTTLLILGHCVYFVWRFATSVVEGADVAQTALPVAFFAVALVGLAERQATPLLFALAAFAQLTLVNNAALCAAAVALARCTLVNGVAYCLRGHALPTVERFGWLLVHSLALGSTFALWKQWQLAERRRLQAAIPPVIVRH